MHRSARFGIVLAAFVALLVTQDVSSLQRKKARPPTTKDMVGVWVGFDSDGLTFSRLDLRSGSTGFFARVSPADTTLHSEGVHVWRITRWSLNGGRMEIHMFPVSNAYPVAYVRGQIAFGALALTIGGTENGGWKEHPLLQSESRMLTSNQETRTAIEAIQK